MPFTFSHPAIIFPIQFLPKRFYSLTGLIIGSMTPDFEYFLRMNVSSIYSHTLWGIIYFDLPLGIMISFIFHDVVRNVLINHLPQQLQERFWDLKVFNWNKAFKSTWLVVIISIITGAVSHVLWDDFTHPLGCFVMKSTFLRHRIQIFGFQVAVYNVLQNISSIIGGIIVWFYIWILPKNEIIRQPKKDSYWLFVVTVVVAILIVRFWSGLTLAKYGNVVVSLISAFFVAIIFFPFFRPEKSVSGELH
ncbi:MAG: DUF4184 family protein [Bacteroidia bacterium]